VITDAPDVRQRVLVWGDLIDDIVVRPDEPIRPDTDTTAAITSRPGGSAANVAAWLGSLGVPVDFVGRVGAVDLERHRSALELQGVTAHLIADHDRPTGTIVVLIDEENRRTMLTQRGANLALVPGDIPDDLLARASVVHFTGYSVFNGASAPQASPESFQRLIARATTVGCAVSVDPGSAGYLADYGAPRFLDAIAGTTVLLPNLDEGRLLTGASDPIEVCGILGKRFPVVAMTIGEHGTCVSVDGGVVELVPVVAVAKADTTGAGDAFDAGFLAAWLRGHDATRAAREAADLAAVSLRAIGGRPTAPAR
jgi:sugar/nucleoside kinase (ribokinase family)